MRRPLVLPLLLGCVAVPSADADAAPPVAGRRPVDARAVATLPAPGTVVPGAIAFAPDGASVTYLKSEDNTLNRVLWRARCAADPSAKVAARPPGQGDTDASVSKEEQLRRERQRLRETGITQVVRAEEADVAILPLAGDLFLLRGDAPLVRLTDTPAAEIDPKPTRDGSKVAFVRDGDLYVLDVASKAETRLTSRAQDGLTYGLAEFMAQEEMGRSSGFWWSPDGASIALEEADERHIPPYTIAHQGGPDYSTETHRYPFPGRDNARVRLGVVPAGGGEPRWFDIADANEEVYLARVDWDGPRSLLVQTLPRDQKTLRLERIDAATGRRTRLIEERSDSWVNLHDDLRVIEATGEILWSSERTGFRHLELRDRDGRLVRTLTAGDWPVDGVVALVPSRREVWLSAGRESPLETHLYRVSLDGGEVTRVTRARGTHRAVVAKDGSTFIDTFSSRNAPPRTILFDRDGNAIATLDDASADPRLAELSLPPPRLTEFKTRDGVTLHGAFYPPAIDPGSRAALVVMVYGGPHIQTVTDSWGLTADQTAQYLAARGFAVWKADNRGSSRRGHPFEAALNRDMGSVEVRDQADGVRFVGASWPEVDTGRVGVTGGSYGGYMTLRCLVKAPETFHAGVAVAPVTDWDGYDTCYTERYMGTPADNPAGYAAASVLKHVEALRGSLLVVHGMLDENVHFRHSARLATALIRANKPYQLLPLPDERHSSRRVEDRQYVAERLAAFFARSLAPSPPFDDRPPVPPDGK